MKPFLLVNTNVTRPPVSPVGLEYVAEALNEAEVPIQVLDLAFESDWRSALRTGLLQGEPLAVGLAVRNIDDSSFATRKSYLPWISELVTETKQLTQAPVILGGCGFSIMPREILEFTGADAGIEGDGEEAAVLLGRSLTAGDDISHVPSLVFRHGDEIVRNPRADADLDYLPVPRRRSFDNERYERMGAIVGVETKRGCSEQCIFCADPVAKGKRIRLRPPARVVQELHDLVEQGVSWLHLCDSEFNMPIEHAKEICECIIQNHLGNRLMWYCYCSPVPFDRELAQLMIRSGCAGINFGVDSLCDEQLLRLGRRHGSTDVAELVNILRTEEVNFMFDLLIGGPGETEQTVRTTIEKVKELDIPLTGISIGVRVYPNTPLGKAIESGFGSEGLHPGTSSLLEPTFYLSPLLHDDLSALVDELVAEDPRFLFLTTPANEESYNYADDEFLCKLIEEGNRGAYWDIIRKTKSLGQ
jgi:radical SAM superfamily enzyme YgiQ (UPF0313 family)